MRSDPRVADCIFALPSNFHDTLDQVIEQTCVMNDIRVAVEVMNSRQIVPERPVFSIRPSVRHVVQTTARRLRPVAESLIYLSPLSASEAVAVEHPPLSDIFRVVIRRKQFLI